MRRHRLTVAGLLMLGAGGCLSSDPWQQGFAPMPQAHTISRSQMADAAPERPKVTTASLLDTRPAQLADPDSGRVAVSIRATVNDVAILDEEVRDASMQQLVEIGNLPEPERKQRLADIYNAALQQLIDREVILQDAYARLNRGGGVKYLDKLKEVANKEFNRIVNAMKEQSGSKTEAELDDKLRGQGLTLAGWKRQFERSFIAQQYMRSRIEPAVERISHEQVIDYYQKHPEEFQTVDNVQWQDIFIDESRYPDRSAARQFAQELADRLRGGENFANLAKFDNGDSSYRNGEGYGRRRGEIRPVEAEPVLFALKDGQVGPVIEQNNGFHVVRLIKREFAGQTPLDEKAQLRIRGKLREQVAQREYKRLLAELKRDATIEYARFGP